MAILSLLQHFSGDPPTRVYAHTHSLCFNKGFWTNIVQRTNDIRATAGSLTETEEI